MKIVSNFTPRLTRPTKGNKNYIRRQNGGWNWCVLGSPTDSQCNVLPNCVGYACGRFNEIYNEIHKTTGHKFPYLNCNAENFPERVKKNYKNLVMDNKPEAGAIMVWQKVLHY